MSRGSLLPTDKNVSVSVNKAPMIVCITDESEVDFTLFCL